MQERTSRGLEPRRTLGPAAAADDEIRALQVVVVEQLADLLGALRAARLAGNDGRVAARGQAIGEPPRAP